MPKAIASPLSVPVRGVSPRGLTILPPSVSPVCVNTASEARAPIGLSTLSSHVPVTSVPLAAAGGGDGGSDCWVGVIEQAAATDATTATHRRRKPGTRKVDIGLTPMSFEGLRAALLPGGVVSCAHSLIAAMAAREPSVRRLLTQRHQDSSKRRVKPARSTQHPIECVQAATPDRAFSSLGLRRPNVLCGWWSNRGN